MGRKKLEAPDKIKRVDVFVQQKKIDLLSKEACAEISQEAIEKEYRKKLKSKQ